MVRPPFLLVVCLLGLVLPLVVLPQCQTRKYSSSLSLKAEAPEFVHWDPWSSTNPSRNRTWAEERAERRDRLNDLVAPDRRPEDFASAPQVAQNIGAALKSWKNKLRGANGAYRKARWGFEWYRDTPVGYSGIPLILFRAIVADAQNDPNSPFRSVWGDYSWYGLTPHPRDFSADGVYGGKQKRVLPLGMGWTRSPLKKPEINEQTVKGLKQAVESGVQNFVRSRIQRAFVSCAACHTGRVVIPGQNFENDPSDVRIEFLYGAPTTEYDQTAFGEATARTLDVVQKLIATPEGRVGLVDRMRRRIRELAKQEAFFPYGNDNSEVIWQGLWQKNVGLLWAKAEQKLILDKMPEVLDALPKRLGLRNTIVGHLEEAAYTGGVEKPEFNGHSPGRIDAFGFGAAIVQVVADQLKTDEYVRRRSETNVLHDWFGFPIIEYGWKTPFWRQPGDRKALEVRVASYMRNLREDASKRSIVPQRPAKVDPTSIWGESPRLRFHANWDGNQRSAGARALSTSLAIVANPAYVDVYGSEFVAHFMAHNPGATPRTTLAPRRVAETLPSYPSASPVYPFEVKEELLGLGKKLFQEHCYTCHHPRNEFIYPIKPDRSLGDRALMSGTNNMENPELYVGTDPLRAIQITPPARQGLLALWNDTCQNRGWCKSSDPDNSDKDMIQRGETDKDVLRVRGKPLGNPGSDNRRATGYVAGPLDGLWARAPFLHNGSVPTIRHLLVPELRDKTRVRCGKRQMVGFWRGNVLYDQENLGFEWRFPPFNGCNADWETRVHTDRGVMSPFDADPEIFPDFKEPEPLYPTASKSARVFVYFHEGSSNKGHDSPHYLGRLENGQPVDWSQHQVQTPAGESYLAADALIEYLKTL